MLAASLANSLIRSGVAVSSYLEHWSLSTKRVSTMEGLSAARGREIFTVLSLKKGECWSLVVQSRIQQAMGLDEEANNSLDGARRLAREIGRGDDFVDQFLTDAGPDVR